MLIDAETHTMELIVPDDKLSLAIGKKGQNVRLASQLTGWRIDIHSESKVREMEARARQSLAAIEGVVGASLAEALFTAGLALGRRGRRGASRTSWLAVPGVGDADAAQRMIANAAKVAEVERERQAEDAARAAKRPPTAECRRGRRPGRRLCWRSGAASGAHQ